jgi:hypothetical protein
VDNTSPIPAQSLTRRREEPGAGECVPTEPQ